MNENQALHIFLGIDCDPRTNKPYDMTSDIMKQAGLVIGETVQRVAKDFVDTATKFTLDMDCIAEEVHVDLYEQGQNNRLKKISSLSSGSQTAFEYIHQRFFNRIQQKRHIRIPNTPRRVGGKYMTENEALNIILGYVLDPKEQKPYSQNSRQGTYALSTLDQLARRIARDKSLKKWAVQENTDIDDIIQGVLIKINTTGKNNRLKNMGSRSSTNENPESYVRRAFRSVLSDKTRARKDKEKQSQQRERNVSFEDIYGDTLLESELVTPAEDFADAEDRKRDEEQLDQREERLEQIRAILSAHKTEAETFAQDYIQNWGQNLLKWKPDLSRQKNTQESMMQFLLEYYSARLQFFSDPKTKMPSSRGSRRARERLIKVLQSKCTDYNLIPMFEVQSSTMPKTEYEGRKIDFEHAVHVYLTLLDMQENGDKSLPIKCRLDSLHQTRDCTDLSKEVAIAKAHVHLRGSLFLLYRQSKNQ